MPITVSPQVPKATLLTAAASRTVWVALAALFVLNALLSMTNWWPTPFVRLDARMAPEFVYAWCAILLWVALWGKPSARALGGMTVLYCFLILGRYIDTTAPALFGRAVNLYWDGYQVPRLLWVLSQKHPWWMSAAIALALALAIWTVFAGVRWAMGHAAGIAATYAVKKPWAWVVSLLLLGVSLANLYGATATWPYVSKPAIPMYIKQAKIIWAGFNENRGVSGLPASPAFTSDLGRLNGADLKLYFLESYGAMTYDNPQVFEQLKPERAALLEQIGKSGKSVVSAFFKSPTFAGGSDLAHMAVMTGIDTSDPLRHDVLLTTDRPTLSKHFQTKGYEAIGFYPGTSWDWPESKFYQFDKLLDGRSLQYEGPTMGYWRIPDQVAMAKLRQLYPVTPTSKPRITLLVSSSSHFPFHPIPPYQPDWVKVTTATPYAEQDLGRLKTTNINFRDMVPAFTSMMRYNHQWLSGYIAQDHAKDYVMVVLGDHQPASSVTGEGASWDVPVHFIASRPELIERMLAAGFKPGLQPPRQAIGNLSDLTTILLNAFDSKH